MANFCVKCGTPLGSGPFCVKCGADARRVAQSVQPQPASVPAQPPQAAAPATQAGPQPVITPPAVPAVAQAVAPKKGMSTLAKLGIAALAVILVGGAAGAVGVYYVAHKVSQKYHEVKDGILGSSSSSGFDSGSGENAGDNGSGVRSPSGGSDSSTNSLGNVCRFLSKEDVSKAIGVEIIRTETGDNTCSYIAKGTQQQMTAKHAAAMVGDKGADKKTQQIAEQFASGIFKMTQESKPQSAQDASGEVPVFNFGLDQNGAEEQIRLNAKVLGNLGDQQGLPGIGDQAFVSADGMIMIRKGKTLVRIMYLTCPCGLEQVKPLAKEIADAL
jgi:hypothetical protein